MKIAPFLICTYGIAARHTVIGENLNCTLPQIMRQCQESDGRPYGRLHPELCEAIPTVWPKFCGPEPLGCETTRLTTISPMGFVPR